MGEDQQEDVNEIVKKSSDPTSSKVLKLELEQHVGEPARRTLPAGSGAITRAYTADETEQWIAEFHHALEDGSENHADGSSERK